MKLQDITNEWTQDSVIDNSKIEAESLKVPLLHSKYLTILSQERILYHQLNLERKKLEMTLDDYYTGKIDGKSIGRLPFQLTETKSSASKRVETDEDLVKLTLRIAIQEEKILSLKEIINSINRRSFDIKNHIDYLKWAGGSF